MFWAYIAGYLCHKVLFKHRCPQCMSAMVHNDSAVDDPKPTADSQGHECAGQDYLSPTHAFIFLKCWWFQKLTFILHTTPLVSAKPSRTTFVLWWLQSINGNWSWKDSVEEISWQTQTMMQKICRDIKAFYGVEKMYGACEDQEWWNYTASDMSHAWRQVWVAE